MTDFDDDQIELGLKKSLKSIEDYSDTLLEYYELMFD
jgi:hypothetical protein